MFSRRAQFALVALALTISNHANAAALAYGTYYDETLPITSCASASSCRSNFSQLPADKLLMVGKINCTMATSSPVTQVVFEISATSGGTPLQRLLPIAAAPSQLIGGLYFTSFREDTHFLVGNGRFPFIEATSSAPASWNILCTMIGELVTPL